MLHVVLRVFETLFLTIRNEADKRVWAQSVERVLRSEVQEVKKFRESFVLRYFITVRLHRPFRVIK
jgi:Na+-transporting NADH:ubiquinone oxidoreductase subunit NqrB